MQSDSFETPLVGRKARGVVAVTPNRPEKRNALSAAMTTEPTGLPGRIDADGTVRAVVLQEAGETFRAGRDLARIKPQVEADHETRIKEAGKLAGMLGALNNLRAPPIGAIRGGGAAVR